MKLFWYNTAISSWSIALPWLSHSPPARLWGWLVAPRPTFRLEVLGPSSQESPLHPHALVLCPRCISSNNLEQRHASKAAALQKVCSLWQKYPPLLQTHLSPCFSDLQPSLAWPKTRCADGQGGMAWQAWSFYARGEKVSLIRDDQKRFFLTIPRRVQKDLALPHWVSALLILTVSSVFQKKSHLFGGSYCIWTPSPVG